MTTNEQALDQAVMKLLATVAVGRHEGRPNTAIVDAVAGQLPELRRLRGEVWLEQQAKALKPKKPRDTAAKRRRALMAELAAAAAARAAGGAS